MSSAPHTRPSALPSVDWPSAELEAVEACPACGADDRATCHEALPDEAFRVAPGRWTLLRCRACGCTHLAVRPVEAAIHRAYASYYTHRPPEGPATGAQGRRRRRRRLVELRHLADALGYEAPPDAPSSARLDARRRLALEREVRHLRRIEGGSLLDVGCGNGAYLALMRQLGWRVAGVEPDATAAGVARQAGVEVHAGGPAELLARPERYDAVTLNHVLEHMHRPAEQLRECWDLVKPGGVLWVATPNPESSGHARYGPHWFALQPPTHIALYTRQAFAALLRRAGIDAEPEHPAALKARWMYQVSACMRAGVDPLRPSGLGWWPRTVARWHAKRADRLALERPSTGEELVAVLRKPLRG